MNQLCLSDWSARLGVMPVFFRHNQSGREKLYAMLDGLKNSFCLDYNSPEDPDHIQADIWSANMSHYLVTGPEGISLYRLNAAFPEKISYALLSGNFDRFYEYLSLQEIPKDESILTFILNRFRRIRENIREEDSAQDSLKIFLSLLSSVSKEKNMYTADGTLSAISRVDADLYQTVQSELKEGFAGRKINLDLVLRHCADSLFQEANYIASFPPQLELFPAGNYASTPRQIGAYFTPPSVARSIVEESLHQIDLNAKKQLVIFDPACGSAVFLAEALRQLKTRNYQGTIRVVGWDLSPIAVEMSKYVLQFEKLEWPEGRMSFDIQCKNSLSDVSHWPEADLILMNPPYKSWYLMDTAERDIAKAVIGTKTEKPNFSSLFYLKAAHALKEGGCIGCLMPQSFLTSDSVRLIRSEALEIAPPVLIGNLGSFVFPSAFVDVCIIVACRERKETVRMMWTRNIDSATENALRVLRMAQSNGRTISSDQYHIYDVKQSSVLDKDRFWPVSKESILIQSRLAELTQKKALSIATELFDIKQGAKTGKNSIFLLTPEEMKSLPVKERLFFKPVIDNDAINDGILRTANYIFFPYSGQQCLLETESELRNRMPVYYKTRLLPVKSLLEKKSGIQAEKWWLLTRRGAFQTDPLPKIVSTQFGRTGCFSFDQSGLYIVERGLAWIARFEDDNQDRRFAYVAIFSSSIFEKLLSLFCRHLAGEVYNLELKYVGQIPIPDLNRCSEDLVDILADLGRKIVAKGVRSIDKSFLDELVLSLYPGIHVK